MVTEHSSATTETDYTLLKEQLYALIHDIPHETANLSNISALLYLSLSKVNWAGFYRLEGDHLILGPFQGKPACIEIPLRSGVCGTAAAQDRTLRVDNVHTFSGHIACDGASNSEIVIPIHDASGQVWGVLDIDSPEFSRFSKDDQEGLEAIVKLLEEEMVTWNQI